ncbi:hypothetical protein F183_A28130 [Bryobacterales bacterium F-183]|nr:hypothetical protein F183_A28130 [Bryobacterales bacterium F-183]
MFAILREQPHYRRLWLASLLSQTGSHISRIAMILWLAEQYGVAPVGWLILCETIPGSLAALCSGAVVDRFDKRKIMIASDLIRLAALLVPAYWATPWVLYLATCICSTAAAFFEPARSASAPLIVPTDALPRAAALDRAASTAVLITGPYAGALIVHWLGLRVALLIDAGSYLLSAVVLWPLAVPQVVRGTVQPLMRDIREGWQYLWNHGVAFEASVLVELSVICVGIWTPLAPAFVTQFLRADDRLIGLQMGLFGLGGLLGAPLAPAAIERWGNWTVLTAMLLAESCMMLVYTLVPSPVLSSLLIVVWGVIVAVLLVTYSSLLQRTVDEAFLGRVFAVTRQLESLGTVAAIGLALLMHDVLPPQRILLLAAIAYVAVTVLYRLSRRSVRLMHAAAA